MCPAASPNPSQPNPSPCCNAEKLVPSTCSPTPMQNKCNTVMILLWRASAVCRNDCVGAGCKETDTTCKNNRTDSRENKNVTLNSKKKTENCKADLASFFGQQLIPFLLRQKAWDMVGVAAASQICGYLSNARYGV